MKIEIEITGSNEATAYPWWVIVNPTEMRPREDDDSNLIDDTTLAFAITGPFFSRAEAETHLKARHYAFRKDAVVWCLSGHATRVYRDAIDKVGAEDGQFVYR